jgi:hypothetical protein
MMAIEYQEKKKEIYWLKYIVLEIYILTTGIRFHKIFFVFEYKLRIKRISWKRTKIMNNPPLSPRCTVIKKTE